MTGVFHYGGYWFQVVDVWPAGWPYEDDCYLEEDGDDYYPTTDDWRRCLRRTKSIMMQVVPNKPGNGQVYNQADGGFATQTIC